MRVSVDIGKDFIDGQTLEEGVKNKIIEKVVDKIFLQIKEQVDHTIESLVSQQVKPKIEEVINASVVDFTEKGIIKIDQKEVKVSEHLQAVFEHNNGWSNPVQAMAIVAKDFGEQVKTRYNISFANMVVQTLNQQGFLKEELVHALMSQKK